MQTRLSPASTALVDAAVLLRAGDLIAFPTETVYGLGADARSDSAIQKIYEAKGRPPGNPLIVHVPDLAAALQCTLHPQNSPNHNLNPNPDPTLPLWLSLLQKLAAKFWPGPLTLILPRGPGISPLVSAGRSTVALRVPNHPVAQALLKAFNAPIAAPSANRSGFTSPTTAAHVFAELNGRIPLILDGGQSEIGLESTVLDLTTRPPTLLRPGAITAAMLEELIGPIQTITATVRENESAISPGQHERHYAPDTPAFRFQKSAWSTCGPSVTRYAGMTATQNGRIILITHDPSLTLPPPHEVILLPAIAADYARALYASLRQADQMNASSILILMPDTTEGLWAAVVDRLMRATVPMPHK